MKKNDFFYHLPETLIAQQPLPQRSASRLLHLNKSTGCVVDRQFGDIVELINDNDLLVFNNTKVIPARLFGKKASGGKVEILLERIVNEYEAIAHVRASKTPKSGALLMLDGGFQCCVQGREGDLFQLEFTGNTPILEVIAEIGHIPLPPYINRADNATDNQRYQSIFAQHAGAVAAPTASLHFDEDIMANIKQKGIQTAFVTLHVGSGTFQPVRVDDLAQHVMHSEFYTVPQATVDAIGQAKARGGRVIAIGTTAVRSLESAAQSGQLAAASGDTRLFITPGYRFKVVDALLTNFHLPESTLLMLVSAFAGYEPVMKAYQHAIDRQYRFFSYGDAMFIGE
ncbi:MAG: tRNA preQ1(34) S-adenosylmethionine ribosyltransferase-isomerase QueA [Gammaproteobacteria bacterium]|nr:tRNA preQ1(34) S-adenosylmethionine ribosyltransferase-isomerase QueA [Gammaproteobacteria bacterium]